MLCFKYNKTVGNLFFKGVSETLHLERDIGLCYYDLDSMTFHRDSVKIH